MKLIGLPPAISVMIFRPIKETPNAAMIRVMREALLLRSWRNSSQSTTSTMMLVATIEKPMETNSGQPKANGPMAPTPAPSSATNASEKYAPAETISPCAKFAKRRIL